MCSEVAVFIIINIDPHLPLLIYIVVQFSACMTGAMAYSSSSMALSAVLVALVVISQASARDLHETQVLTPMRSSQLQSNA